MIDMFRHCYGSALGNTTDYFTTCSRTDCDAVLHWTCSLSCYDAPSSCHGLVLHPSTSQQRLQTLKMTHTHSTLPIFYIYRMPRRVAQCIVGCCTALSLNAGWGTYRIWQPGGQLGTSSLYPVPARPQLRNLRRLRADSSGLRVFAKPTKRRSGKKIAKICGRNWGPVAWAGGPQANAPRARRPHHQTK